MRPDDTDIVDNLQSAGTLRRMPRSPLPSGADVVIVGGGVVGVSAAFHLAEAGAEVVLLERDQLASGSTSKAAGGLSAQFSDALNIEIAKRSLAAYKAFEQRPGWEIDYEEIGYLFVLTTETEVDAFKRSVALQNELGVPSRIIDANEAIEICPLLAGEDILAASYCPTDAHATPRGRRAGLRLGRPRARRAHRGDHAGRGDRRQGRRDHAGPHHARHDRHRHGDLRRRRVVKSVRRDGRRPARRHAAAPPGPLHRADARPAATSCR